MLPMIQTIRVRYALLEDFAILKQLTRHVVMRGLLRFRESRGCSGPVSPSGPRPVSLSGPFLPSNPHSRIPLLDHDFPTAVAISP